MELRQLEHFVAVVDEQHFTRAARRCHMSQSALSASIRALEREFDTALFIRTTRRVEVTEAGRALVEQARLILAALSAARDAVNATTGQLTGVLHIGGIQMARTSDQAELLARFHARYPDVEIHYTSGSSPALIDDVRLGRLDVAFVSLSSRPPTGVDVRPFASFPLTLVCLPDHPLAAASSLTVEQLADESFLGWPAHSPANSAIDHVQRVLGRERGLPIQVNDALTMLEFVAHGLGVALLPDYLAAERPPLVAVPIDDPNLVWHAGIAVPRTSVSQTTVALLELVGQLQDENHTTGAAGHVPA